jgi:hypothetical protein
MTEDEKIDVIALHLVGGRLADEPSHAKPQHYYQDPSKAARFNAEGREPDRVQMMLDEWADWMRKPESMSEGFPSEVSAFITSWRKDFEDLTSAADAERMERINAAFDSLEPRFKDAILRHYKLGRSVWQFAHPASLFDAKISLRVKFVLKGLL